MITVDLMSKAVWSSLIKLACRYIARLPDKFVERMHKHREVGFSGFLGGFQEEKAYLDMVATDIMPTGHQFRANLDMMTQRIAFNAQWPWHYKVRAVQKAARLLLLAENMP
jgi:hypothetical protein